MYGWVKSVICRCGWKACCDLWEAMRWILSRKAGHLPFLARCKYAHSSKLPGHLAVSSGLVNGLCSAFVHPGRNAVRWDSTDATITPAWNADLWILDISATAVDLGCYGLSQNPECAKAQIMTGHRTGLLRDLQRQQCKVPPVALVFDLLVLLLFLYLEETALQ